MSPRLPDDQWPGGPGYYDKDGQPIDLTRFCELMQEFEYRSIDRTTVGPYLVSTIWLGIDQNFAGVGPPLIFETMVFAEETPMHEFTDHMPTLEAARANHRHVVDLVRWELEHAGDHAQRPNGNG